MSVLKQLVPAALFGGGVTAIILSLTPRSTEQPLGPSFVKEARAPQVPSDKPLPSQFGKKGPNGPATGLRTDERRDGSARSERERGEDDDESERRRDRNQRLSEVDARALVEKLNRGKIVKSERKENHYRFEVQSPDGKRLRVEVTFDGRVAVKS